MKKKSKSNQLTVVLCCIAGVLLVALAIMLILLALREEEPPVVTEPPTEAVTLPAETTAPTEPPETEPVMLDFMAELYEENSDVAGWLRIDDTVVDYPVMYTPDDEEKYLRANFDGNYSVGGCLLIDADCSFDPESDNLIIYGHNMRNGTMFNTLLSYVDEEFWEEHPEIYFATLYEERTYEVLAAFYDRVYYKYEDVFKFYQFIDAEDEAHFAEAISNFKEKAEYDTGITAEYGDKLITLVTCSYHTDYGRFVVVAREKTDETDVADVTEVAEANP